MENEFLMISAGQYIPDCIPNRCKTDGLVTFKNSCHTLNKPGPCPFSELTYVVSINSTTLELECIQENPDIVSRLGEEDTAYYDEAACFRGSRRAVQGIC